VGLTISVIIPEVCQAIVEEYNDEVIICPPLQKNGYL